MKRYFLYSKTLNTTRSYIGVVDCEEFMTKMGLHFFFIQGEMILRLVSSAVEVEERTEEQKNIKLSHF